MTSEMKASSGASSGQEMPITSHGSLSASDSMREAGARGVATGRRWIADSGVMLRLLQYAAMLDLVVVAHAEDAALVGSAVATAGEIATRRGLPSAPVQAEALALARDIALAETLLAAGIVIFGLGLAGHGYRNNENGG